jgi:hypothetical protein
MRNVLDKICRKSKNTHFYFNAMNSVHFCSITLRFNQMHYFYYLKNKNYLQYTTEQQLHNIPYRRPKMARDWRPKHVG